MPKTTRGIRIALSRESWELVCEALTYVVEKPHLDHLEESREDLGGVLRYVRKELKVRDEIVKLVSHIEKRRPRR